MLSNQACIENFLDMRPGIAGHSGGLVSEEVFMASGYHSWHLRHYATPLITLQGQPDGSHKLHWEVNPCWDRSVSTNRILQLLTQTCERRGLFVPPHDWKYRG